MPLCLKKDITGFISFVKTYGAVHSPNGKHVNSYMLFSKEILKNFLDC